MVVMDEVLGLLALAGYIVGIIGLAAGITYVVIRIFPTERDTAKPGTTDQPEPEKAKEGGSSAGESAAGALFRRAKRGKR